MKTLSYMQTANIEEEYCSICIYRGEEDICPCKMFNNAEEKTKREMLKIIEGEING